MNYEERLSILTQIRHLTERCRDVELHTIVSQFPVVSRPSVSLHHDTVDTKSLESSGQDGAPVEMLSAMHAGEEIPKTVKT